MAFSEVEKFDRVMNKAVRKWLGVPSYLSTVALYGKEMFPIISLVEEFKCAKTSFITV